MASGGDIQLSSGQGAAVVQVKRLVTSGTTGSILGGQPVKETAAGWDGNVLLCASGDGTTSQRIAGIAKNQSSETTSVAGTVETWLPLPGIIWRAKALVSTNANTAALIDGLKGKRVKFNLTSSIFTVDTAQSDASTNGIVITGGDFNTSTIEFVIAGQATSYFV